MVDEKDTDAVFGEVLAKAVKEPGHLNRVVLRLGAMQRRERIANDELYPVLLALRAQTFGSEGIVQAGAFLNEEEGSCGDGGDVPGHLGHPIRHERLVVLFFDEEGTVR